MITAHFGATPQSASTTSTTATATVPTHRRVTVPPSPGDDYVWVGDHWERRGTGSGIVRETPADKPENIVVVGPFQFYAKGSRLTFHGDRQKLSSLPPAWAAFLVQAVDDISKKALMAGQTLPYTLKGWGVVEPRVAAGSLPIARVTNPIEGGNWGLYANIADDRILWMEFKPVPKDWVDKIGAALVGIAKAVIEAARKLCGITENQVAQAVMATSDSKPIKTGQALCQLFFSPDVPSDTTEDGTAPVERPLAERLPVGSIQTLLPDGRWAYAVPKGSHVLQGLGSFAFVPPRAQKAPSNDSSEWYDIKTANAPYLATWGVGTPYEQVGTGPVASSTAATVDLQTFKDKTTPFYKKWWFWTAVGGTMAAGAGYYVYRRK